MVCMKDCKGLKSSLVLPVPVAQGRGSREAFPKAEKLERVANASTAGKRR